MGPAVVVSKREESDSAHWIVRRCFQHTAVQLCKRHLHEVSIGGGLAVEEPRQRNHVAQLHLASLQLALVQRSGVDQASSERRGAVGLGNVDAAFPGEQVQPRRRAHIGLAGETLCSELCDETPDGLVPGVVLQLAAVHFRWPPVSRAFPVVVG